jgi:hypothetical protein
LFTWRIQKKSSNGPPLWSSGQSSWLQIQRSRVRFWLYQIFCEVVNLERGPLSLVITIKELLGRKSNGSGLESREYGRRDPLRWLRDTLYPQKLALTSPTRGGRSAGIVRSRTQATKFVCLLYLLYLQFKFVFLKLAFSLHHQPRIVRLVTYLHQRYFGSGHRAGNSEYLNIVVWTVLSAQNDFQSYPIVDSLLTTLYLVTVWCYRACNLRPLVTASFETMVCCTLKSCQQKATFSDSWVSIFLQRSCISE